MQLAPLFTDHAVLQRDRSLPIWGSATPGSDVVAELAGQRARTIADRDGRWLLRFTPLAAGGPHTLTVSDAATTVTITNVLIGDVWLCSGQSNMQWSLSQTAQGQDLMRDTDLSRLRLLSVSTPATLGAQTRIDGTWQQSSELSLAKFSAVGAWFGRTLLRDRNIPIGLICNAWGGTRVQAWMSRAALMQDPCGQDEIRHYEGYLYALDRMGEGEYASMTDWERRGAPQDRGNHGLTSGWARPDFDDSAWKTMPLPSPWQNHGHPGSGVFWFRHRVQVPKAWQGRDLMLNLGAVDKHDDTYVNGERVGGLSWDFGPQSWNTPRCYRIPAALIPADGSLCIAIRARSHAYHGGLIGPKEAMGIHSLDDPKAAIPLATAWRYAIEQDWGIVIPPTPPWGPGNPNSPGILFDSRIAPLLPYAITGVIWYQGESNAAEAPVYARMLPAMIRDWRRAWGQGDFPFLQVQLANYMAPIDQPARSHWAELRDAQIVATRTEANTYAAIAIDVGEANDIHPRDKRSVGERLARLALNKVYATNTVPCGPLFQDAVVESGGRIRCHFLHADSLRTRDGKPVTHVSIAGPSRQFIWAESRIEGDTLVVWHPQVPRPAAVRYAWADNPDGCNLINGEGLPASPFRSDSWSA